MRRRPIAAHNLREVYGPKAAVDGLNLEVPRGSAARKCRAEVPRACFFGVLGPIGARKTTTTRMLIGLAPPTSGSIDLLACR